MANFDKVINRYGTYSTQWDYVQDRFGESKLLPFSISDMDFEIPSGTKEILGQAVSHGVFGYTRWNHKDFKNSISQWFKNEFECTLENEWIVFSPSVIYSLSVFIQLLGKKQKRIVTFTPCYDAFFNTVRENGGTIIPASLKKVQGEFVIDFEKLKYIFKTEHPEFFLLCNPHNPTGRSFTVSELTLLIDLCNQHNVAIISDEIHMDIRRPGIKHYPILFFLKQIKVPVILLSSASKSFNTPGLGCSYAIIPDQTLKEKFLKILKERDGLSSVPYLGMLALQECYTSEKKWLNELNDYIDGNFKYLYETLKNHSQLHFVIPESTYLGWIEIKKANLDMNHLQNILIHEEKVAIMRGDTYGKEGSNYLRLNLGAPLSKIKVGTEALLKSLDKY